jgi:hypothetical protein
MVSRASIIFIIFTRDLVSRARSATLYRMIFERARYAVVDRQSCPPIQ